MRIEFHEWDNFISSHCLAASLPEDEIQIWFAVLRSFEDDLIELAHSLSLDEQNRAGRFLVEEPRRQFITGRGVLRQLLGACLDIAPTALSFSYQPQGKPFLDQPSGRDLFFNLSHSERFVIIALARNREVGVDVEWLDGRSDWSLLAERIFSPRELAELRSLPALEQRQAFFNGWTRKEAYLKATGEGLIDNLSDIEVTLTPEQEPRLLGLPTGAEDARTWALRTIPLASDFAGAIVFAQ
jgi:4'-phosphopantetheinyl transferase